jgi:hypothetical protein
MFHHLCFNYVYMHKLNYVYMHKIFKRYVGKINYAPTMETTPRTTR